MARIRSLKPEFWDDRKLARAVSRDGRMLYMGLWNQADEHSRVNGDAVWLKGRIFPYDDDVTTDILKLLLDELVIAGRVVAYEVDGDPYLFIPKLGAHQRLEPKVDSRLPPPPSLGAENVPQSPARIAREHPNADLSAPDADSSALLYVAGSREQVASSRGTREDAHDSDTSAQTIVAEWIEHSPKRPPSQVIGQASKAIRQMLAEGIDPDDVRRGVAAWMAKGLHPSTLPSVVNEVMNASPRASPNGSGSTKAAGWLALGTPMQSLTGDIA